MAKLQCKGPCSTNVLFSKQRDFEMKAVVTSGCRMAECLRSPSKVVYFPYDDIRILMSDSEQSVFTIKSYQDYDSLVIMYCNSGC